VPGMYRNLVAWSRSLRFLQLAVFILLFLLIVPFIGGHPYISFIFQILLLNALLVSLSASDRLPRVRGGAAWFLYQVALKDYFCSCWLFPRKLKSP
jgi:hypothetical protein